MAESCTGGGLGARITALPGCSAFFKGGVIAYANEVKQTMLGVPAALLNRHGAVSAPVARRMATAVRRRFRATFGLAITGIAGPDGGSPTKPVGTVWIALAGPAGTVVRHHRFSGSRARVRAQAVDQALRLLCQLTGRHKKGKAENPKSEIRNISHGFTRIGTDGKEDSD